MFLVAFTSPRVLITAEVVTAMPHRGEEESGEVEVGRGQVSQARSQAQTRSCRTGVCSPMKEGRSAEVNIKAVPSKAASAAVVSGSFICLRARSGGWMPTPTPAASTATDFDGPV